METLFTIMKKTCLNKGEEKMEQGTINKDITLKYDTDNDNLIVSSTYVATKKSVDDLSNKTLPFLSVIL